MRHEEREITISLCLRQLRILAKRLDVGKLLDDVEDSTLTVPDIWMMSKRPLKTRLPMPCNFSW